jgi:hypothetical protein
MVGSYLRPYTSFNKANAVVMVVPTVLTFLSILKEIWFWQNNNLNLSHEFRTTRKRSKRVKVTKLN